MLRYIVTFSHLDCENCNKGSLYVLKSCVVRFSNKMINPFYSQFLTYR